jgi:hypothetical protein
MSKEGKGEGAELVQVRAGMVYQADPLGRFLIETLGLRGHTVAFAALSWGLIYIVVLPALFGGLRSSGGYLGSLDDWHAQLLLLLVFPAVCAFYLWQPGAVAGVYAAILSGDRSCEVGTGYRQRIWTCLSLIFALAVILFDLPKMMASYGSWWMVQNWVTLAGREASLAIAFYMLSMMAWRQAIATLEWRQLLGRPSTAAALEAVSRYGLKCAFLLALIGLRLSVEGIELPQRAGAITPDYYVKIAIYVGATLACFFAPMSKMPRCGLRTSRDQVITLLQLAGIIVLPLLAFVFLKLVL